ncbi:MAG: hypothetical protein JST28_02255 [Acidobacteria bacterium]|nr:hypothetical protein [Acidobacteriota bacterium]
MRRQSKDATMELLDRYLQAVRKYLPLRRQDDIIAELRANMESQIEDLESELGRALTQGELDDFLRKMGHPMVVASRYQPQQYLIGPTMFPMYLYVLRLAMLWAFIVCMVVAAVVTPLTEGTGGAVVAALFRTPGILIQTAAWITLVFAAFEFARTRYPNICPQIEGLNKGWNPSTLPPIEKDSLRKGKPRSFAQAVAEIIFSVLFLGWVLLIPHYPFILLGPGVVFLKTSSYELAPVWWTFFGWIVALGIMQIVARCIDLARGTWERPSIIQHFAFKVVGLIPVLVLLAAPGHIYVSLKNSAADPAQLGKNLAEVNNAIHLGFSVVCAIVVLQLAFDIGKLVTEAYRKREVAS